MLTTSTLGLVLAVLLVFALVAAARIVTAFEIMQGLLYFLSTLFFVVAVRLILLRTTHGTCTHIHT